MTDTEAQTVEKHQNVTKLIEELSDMAGSCHRQADRELIVKATGYLINYQVLIAMGRV